MMREFRALRTGGVRLPLRPSKGGGELKSAIEKEMKMIIQYTRYSRVSRIVFKVWGILLLFVFGW